MRHRLYNIFIAPRQSDSDLRNREIVLNTLLAGTLGLLLVSLVIMIAAMFILGHSYVVARVAGIAVATFFISTVYYLSRTRRYLPAASLLVGLYFFLATSVTYSWGIITPTGILLYGLVIVLAGILLGPRYSLYAAGGITLLLTALQLAAERGIINPDWTWLRENPSIGDVVGSALIFSIIALVSWLFNFLMEQSLHRAVEAETALTKQKMLLETTVEERTRELQAAQLEKIQQMYRFAELGQLSTAMMHDLANHLTSLTLNIESLEGRNRSKVLSQAKRSIHHIDDMVVRVRDQLQGRAKVRTFNVAGEIDEIVKMLRHRGHLARVDLSWKSPEDKKALRCRGETIRFRQMMANLICNGFDAYEGMAESDKKRMVVVAVSHNKSYVTITVDDWGCGIPAKDIPILFEPFHSTKKTGMGMGLFIVKQIAEEHFLGSVGIDQSKKYTSFIVKLPRTD